jgi:hypothetical protein
MIVAQKVVNAFTGPEEVNGVFYTTGDWSSVWFIFAGYSLVVAILFALIFRYKHTAVKK